MRDITTQWFVLNRPYVKIRKVTIGEEIEKVEETLKKLKRQKRDGYLIKTRRNRLYTAAGIRVKIADATNNKVIGYEIPENETSYITRERIEKIKEYLEENGYEPEFGCVRESFTKGGCKYAK